MNKKVDRAARILVLEDDPSLREVLQEVLEARGLEVMVASHGEEALQLARANPFDLIVADIRMKGISGLDAIEQAQQLQPGLASIVVSGYATEQETLRAVQLNVAGYLKKPFKIPKLLELVNKFLQQRRSKIQTEEEIRNLRKSLLWSFSQQNHWAEKAHPGLVERPAYLAHGLAQAKGLSPGLCRQIYTGTALRAGLSQSGAKVPKEVLQSLETFSFLYSALEGDELSQFALKTAGDVDFPGAEDLSADVPAQVRELYSRFLERESKTKVVPNPTDDKELTENENALALAANLIRLGDIQGADRVLDEVLQANELSPRTIQAHLSKVQTAILRGRTPTLESHLKQALDAATKLGPSMLAQVQWKGAEQLRRARHPAAGKLYRRAAESLKSLELIVPWSCCVITLAALGEEVEETVLLQALKQLAEPADTSELDDFMVSLLPSLFLLAARRGQPEALELCRKFANGYYFETGSVLLDESLPNQARLLALEKLARSKLGLGDDIVKALKQVGNPEICSRLEEFEGDRENTTLQLRAHCFGSFAVFIGTTQVPEKDWKTQKTKYLLARLLESHPRPLQVEQVLEEFWPDKGDYSRSSLNTSVSNLRKILKDTVPEGEDALQRHGMTLSLHPKMKVWSDEKLVNAALRDAADHWERGEMERATSSYARVVRLYEGPYLEGSYLDWALVRRSYFENNVVIALSRLMEQRFASHRCRESHEYAMSLLRIQPDDTRSHEVAMLSLLGLDQHQSALDHYEKYSRELLNEYGSEPSMELVRVYQMARYGFRQVSGLNAF